MCLEGGNGGEPLNVSRPCSDSTPVELQLQQKDLDPYVV